MYEIRQNPLFKGKVNKGMQTVNSSCPPAQKHNFPSVLQQIAAVIKSLWTSALPTPWLFNAPSPLGKPSISDLLHPWSQLQSG